LSRTVRKSERPSFEEVAKLIAVGSVISDLQASLSQT